jgi:chromosome partitioning protein
MHRIAIISAKGGTGRTTVAANLARQLAERARVVAVDADPQNALGLLFGMPVGEPNGLSSADFHQSALMQMLRAQQAELPFIPFGRPSHAALAALESHTRLDPTWLDKRIRELSPPGVEYLVVDTPMPRSVWFQQAVSLATVLVVTLEACALSYATLPEVDEAIEEATRRPDFKGVFYLLNRVDGRRVLSRDVQAAMTNAVGERLLDVSLIDDEHVREASAARTTCVQLAPHSQFTTAMRTVAGHVLELTR